MYSVCTGLYIKHSQQEREGKGLWERKDKPSSQLYYAVRQVAAQEDRREAREQGEK